MTWLLGFWSSRRGCSRQSSPEWRRVCLFWWLMANWEILPVWRWRLLLRFPSKWHSAQPCEMPVEEAVTLKNVETTGFFSILWRYMPLFCGCSWTATLTMQSAYSHVIHKNLNSHNKPQRNLWEFKLDFVRHSGEISVVPKSVGYSHFFPGKHQQRWKILAGTVLHNRNKHHQRQTPWSSLSLLCCSWTHTQTVLVVSSQSNISNLVNILSMSSSSPPQIPMYAKASHRVHGSLYQWLTLSKVS